MVNFVCWNIVNISTNGCDLFSLVAAIVVIGLTHELESEGFDRPDMKYDHSYVASTYYCSLFTSLGSPVQPMHLSPPS